jgi:hypothetical protein
VSRSWVWMYLTEGKGAADAAAKVPMLSMRVVRVGLARVDLGSKVAVGREGGRMGRAEC